MNFDIRDFSSLPWAELVAPLVEAEDALARLDERLHASPIRDGWIERSHFIDACGSLWLEGDLVTLEDLVLHDADADARAPTPQLLRAQKIVDVRRQITSYGSAWALSSTGLIGLLQQKHEVELISIDADDHVIKDPLELDPLDLALADIDAALARSSQALKNVAPIPAQGEMLFDSENSRSLVQWQKLIDTVDRFPPILAAGLLWDFWETQPPVWRREWMGRQMVSAYLVKCKKTPWHLPALNSGLKLTPWERRRSPDKLVRLLTWLKAIISSVEESLREHERLKTGLYLLERKCKERRSSSHLPELVSIIGRCPLVTVGMVAKKLSISQRAAQNLIGALELKEITGRERYRAWML